MADNIARGLALRALNSTGAGSLSTAGGLRSAMGGCPTYSAGYVGLTPAANPTDIAVLMPQDYSGAAIFLRRVSISATADTAATVDVLLQRSPNGGGGTMVAMSRARHELSDALAWAAVQVYTANRSSNGNGISNERPVFRAGKLSIGTATTQAPALVWEFDREKAPCIRNLIDYLVVNLNAQTLPANTKIDIDIEWHEENVPRVAFAGDSTFSNALDIFATLGRAGYVTSQATINNLGSNGYRLTDYLMHTNGVTYPQGGGAGVLNYKPDVLVIGYGINDVRTGATSQAQLISMIDAAIYATLNGTTSGATYTSPLGAGTVFTWPATIAAVPDCKIILWGPNSFTSDGNGSNFVEVGSGVHTGLTVPQAAQFDTDLLYNAYEAFRNDGRIHALVQRQDVTGRTITTVAANGLMTDILHPNARGQVLLARQIKPFLVEAIADAAEYIF